MGSGLILLVIVAAWLAVLVPMALRSHDATTSLSSVDRFSDAMRVLSRRDAAARALARREDDDDPLSAQAWAENDAWDDDWDDDWDDERVGWRDRLGGWGAQLGRGARRVTGGIVRAGALVARLRPREQAVRLARQAPRVSAPSSPAVRRRRVLLTLLALTAASAVGGAVGPRVLLVSTGVLVVAVALFVVQLRRLAVARAARTRRAPSALAQRPQPARSGSVRVQPADVPVVAGGRARHEVADPASGPAAEPAAEPAPAVASPAVRHDEPVPAPAEPAATARTAAPAAALGGAWSPVPVPPPIYVNAPVAPARAPRIVDLTRPGSWSEQEGARVAEELPGGAPAVAPAPERRRAVNEW